MRTQAIINDFQNEFQMMRKLDHKNIVKLRGLSIPSGRLVMEYIELGSLFSWLCQKNKQVCDDYRAKVTLFLRLKLSIGIIYLKVSCRAIE